VLTSVPSSLVPVAVAVAVAVAALIWLVCLDGPDYFTTVGLMSPL